MIASSARVLMIVVPIVVLTSEPCTGQEKDPIEVEIDEKLPRGKQIFDDPLSNEKSLKSVQSELKDLLTRVDDLLGPTGGETNPNSPVVKARAEIAVLLAKIEGRLPDLSPSSGATRRSAWPVPFYSEEKVVGAAGRELMRAQVQMASYLRKDVRDSEKTGELLIKMLVAQEDLAWEAGWPFTDEEAAAIRDEGEVSENVYLSRRSRGVKRINERLTTEATSVGRQPSKASFVIFHPTSEDQQKLIAQILVKKRGRAASVWIKGTTAFDDK